jgi:hypothetical protein
MVKVSRTLLAGDRDADEEYLREDYFNVTVHADEHVVSY